MRIRELYDRPVPTISFEFFPPKNDDAEAVLFRDTAASGAWSTLTNFTIAASTNVTVTNLATATRRFYRVGER